MPASNAERFRRHQKYSVARPPVSSQPELVWSSAPFHSTSARQNTVLDSDTQGNAHPVLNIDCGMQYNYGLEDIRTETAWEQEPYKGHMMAWFPPHQITTQTGEEDKAECTEGYIDALDVSSDDSWTGSSRSESDDLDERIVVKRETRLTQRPPRTLRVSQGTLRKPVFGKCQEREKSGEQLGTTYVQPYLESCSASISSRVNGSTALVLSSSAHSDIPHRVRSNEDESWVVVAKATQEDRLRTRGGGYSLKSDFDDLVGACDSATRNVQVEALHNLKGAIEELLHVHENLVRIIEETLGHEGVEEDK